MRMEPACLRRGKAFHQEVQADWEETAEGKVHCERTTALVGTDQAKRVRRGRMDLFVDGFARMVVVVEIKATDWDNVKNVQRLLSGHRRQIWKYIEKKIDIDGFDVCPGMIYPTAPKNTGLKERIEEYLNDHAIQVVWYHD